MELKSISPMRPMIPADISIFTSGDNNNTSIKENTINNSSGYGIYFRISGNDNSSTLESNIVETSFNNGFDIDIFGTNNTTKLISNKVKNTDVDGFNIRTDFDNTLNLDLNTVDNWGEDDFDVSVIDN